MGGQFCRMHVARSPPSIRVRSVQDFWHPPHISPIGGRPPHHWGRATAGGDKCEEGGNRELHGCCGWEVALDGKDRCLGRSGEDRCRDEKREVAIILEGTCTYARTMHWLGLLHYGRRSLCSNRAGLRTGCERYGYLHVLLLLRFTVEAGSLDRHLAQVNTVSVTLDGQDFDIHKRAGEYPGNVTQARALTNQWTQKTCAMLPRAWSSKRQCTSLSRSDCKP